MRWCCFLFWFIYRLTLACLAHFNWLTSIYVNCAYFVLWKSYDLLWFWMHLMLCICFKPLRSENYLIVWCNLIRKRITQYPNSTYKEIYMVEYGKFRKSKVEQELDRISEAEASETGHGEQDSDSDEDNNQISNSGKDEANETVSGNIKSDTAKIMAEAVRNEEERECIEQVFLSRATPSATNKSRLYAYSSSNVDIEPPTAPPRIKKKAAKLHEQQQNLRGDEHLSLRERWNRFDIRERVLKSFRSCKQCNSCAPCRTSKNNMNDAIDMENDRASSESEGGSQVGITDRIRRYLPLVRARQNPSDEDQIDILTPDFTNKLDLTNAKQLARREKRDRKALTKRLRARRRAELAIIAKYEAKQKTISNAIELLLQILRMMTSFAILVGNIRKTFIPAQFKWLKPGRHAYDNPELMMLWRFTVFLDVLLFWTNVIWAYCLQWHLCCRLGLLKFWTWVFILVMIGGLFMLYPMSYVQDNLDISWCRFKTNSTLSLYQPNW